MFRLVLVVATAVLLSGCVTTSRMPTYVVEFTLSNTSGDDLLIQDYPHCGTSELRERYLRVDAPKPKGKALVHIDPSFQGAFVATGTEELALGLVGPVGVPDGIADTDFAVVTLELRAGTLLIDGVERDLPFSGASTVPGWWNATFSVREGPGVVRVDHRSYPCM